MFIRLSATIDYSLANIFLTSSLYLYINQAHQSFFEISFISHLQNDSHIDDERAHGAGDEAHDTGGSGRGAHVDVNLHIVAAGEVLGGQFLAEQHRAILTHRLANHPTAFVHPAHPEICSGETGGWVGRVQGLRWRVNMNVIVDMNLS